MRFFTADMTMLFIFLNNLEIEVVFCGMIGWYPLSKSNTGTDTVTIHRTLCTDMIRSSETHHHAVKNHKFIQDW